MPEEAKTGEVKDAIVECIGSFGRWQLLMTFLLSLFNLPCTFHIYALTYEAANPSPTCAKPSNSHFSPEQWRNLSAVSGKWDECRIRDLDYSLTYQELSQVKMNGTLPCTSWDYDTSHFGKTIVSEWDLVCDRAQLQNVAGMMFLLGVAIGGIVCGFISDRFGRKKTLMVSLLAQILLGYCIAFTPWLSLFLILRGFLGFVSVSVVFSGIVLCMELVGGKWLNISGVAYVLPVPIAYILISGLAYVIRDWRYLQITITSSALLLLPLWWILPESPRWLLAMCRKEQIMDVLNKAAAFNGKQLPENADKILQMGMIKRGEKTVSVLELFSPKFIRRTLLLYVIWFCIIMVYFGLVLNLSFLGGDIYLDSVISGAVEIPAIAVSIIFLLKLGRKWPLALAAGGGGISCILASLTNKGEWLHLTLVMIGRLFSSSANVVISIYTAELYPTAIRNLGLGSSNFSSGIALILVPYIWNLAEMAESLPLIALGLCGVVGALAILMLPETAGLMEDFETS